jgi:hypothetical protein
MKTIALLSTSVAAMLLPLLHVTPAQAIPRTWVASNGAGAACTRAAPCATFQAAHDATDAGGEVNCVDPGEYGRIDIIKSITIDCTGTYAGISPTGGLTNVFIDAASVVVVLRGLNIDGLGGSNIGVAMANGAALHIENCRISSHRGGLGVGVRVTSPSGVTGKVYISDTVIAENGLAASGGGIVLRPTGTGVVRAVLNRVLVHNNTYGIFADGMGGTGSVIMQIRDSESAGNVFNGISAFTSASTGITSVTVDRTASTLNGNIGVLAQGSNAYVLLSDSTVLSNATGLSAASGGSIFTYQDNHRSGNLSDGAATGPLTVN